LRRLVVALVAMALSVVAVPAAADTATGTTSPSRSLPAFAPVGQGDGLSRALADGRLTRAQYSLERAASVFAYDEVARRFGGLARVEGRLATLVLRDLAVRFRDLTGEDRARALSLMARPDDDEPNAFQDGDPEYGNRTVETECDPDICVHYVDDAAYPNFDHAADELYAQQVLATLQNVWATEVAGYGYREPKPDTNVLNGTSDGGDARFDVYLANLRPLGVYGYCFTNDAKANTNFTTYDFSTYCVLDDDYLNYGYADPSDPLEVTAAHEFFHAVQGAYDFLEDAYFMEGTATWMEDEVYDPINDHHFYLDASPLSNPTIPLDKAAGLRVYGTWIWWRFLSESLADADVVRDIWNRADGSAAGPDKYSTQATALELKARGSSFGDAFADFAAWNAKPSADGLYDEGSAYGAAKTQERRTVSTSRRSFTSNATLDHLTSRGISVKRGSGVSADAKLKVAIDGPTGKTSPQARVVLFRTGGAVTVVAFNLNDVGRGTKRVAFGSDVTKAVVLVANASTRFKACYQDPKGTYSCWGTPLDENLGFHVRASLIQ
jgi:hypothetical protein